MPGMLKCILCLANYRSLSVYILYVTIGKYFFPCPCPLSFGLSPPFHPFFPLSIPTRPTLHLSAEILITLLKYVHIMIARH